MASENIEIVRRGFEALAEHGVEALIPLLHPEFEFTTPPELAAEPDTYRGEDGLRRYFESFYEVMDEVHFEPLSFEAVGNRVVGESSLTARGQTTGLEFEQRVVLVWELRDGKFVGLEIYATVDEALEAARAAEGD
jgi:ketosteroid isomerase-like protein